METTISRRRTSGRLRSSTRLRTLAAVALLLGAGIAAYAASFRGVFVFDDITAIESNPHIRALWPIRTAMSAPPDVTLAGRPVASLTFAMNYALAPADARDIMSPGDPFSPRLQPQVFARNIWGYHAANLAIHLAAGMALFGIVRRTLRSSPMRENHAGHADAVAFAAALIWLVHPVNTSAVTYVVQRVESLMGLFYLLTVYCAIRASESTRRRGAWTVTAVLVCALGMATKEVMVTAPLVVAAWLWLFRERDAGPPARASVAGAMPLLASLAATWAILAALVATGARSESVGFSVGGWTWWSYLVTQGEVVLHYLRLSIAPWPLVFTYGWRPAALSAVWPHVFVVTALLTATALALVKRRPVAFLGIWWFAILAPSSSVLPIATEVAAEHRLYLPLAAVVAGVVLAVTSIGARWFSGTRARVAAGVVATALATLILGTMTSARNGDYHSEEALMGDTVAKRPAHAQARVLYGAELLRLRRFADAEAQLRVAVDLPPPFGAHAQWTSLAHLYLGSALCAQEKFAEGIRQLDTALTMNSDLTEAYALLGDALAATGQHVRAAESFRQAVSLMPDNLPVLERAADFFRTTPDPLVRDTSYAATLSATVARLRAR